MDANCGRDAAALAPPSANGIEADVFRLFPYGLLVLDASGAPLKWNAEAAALLPSLPSAAHCCELFGCRHEDAPTRGACVTELAVDRGSKLPELRLDLPGDGGAVWLTAAPLGGDPGRVVLELRSADPLDRRRRSEPHWLGPKQLRIMALGRTRVESHEAPIGGAWLEQRPGQVLKYLVSNRGRVVTIEEIAEAIWPDAGRRALGSVRHFVHELRDRLEPGRLKRTPSSFVVSRQGGYLFDRRHVSIDADEFEDAVRAGNAAYAGGDAAAAIDELERAMALYGGDLFAEDPYELWAIGERDRLRELAAGALRTLAELTLQAGRPDMADDHLRRLVEIEPFDLQVHKRLIEGLLRRGRRDEAARRLKSLRRRILHEFGEELDFGLADLGPDPRSQLTLG